MRNKLQIILFLVLGIILVHGKLNYTNAQPSVQFSYKGVCLGSPTVFTVDTAVTEVNAVQIWHWDFGDGSFSNIQNPANTYAGFGTYTVTLTITDTNGAVGSASQTLVIKRLPVVNFSFTSPNCSNDPIQFTDLSYCPDGGFIRRWIWNYGDGSPNDTTYFPNDPNKPHVFPGPNTYNVTLMVMDNDSCVNQDSRPVTVMPSPIANFHFTGACEDQVVSFTDASSANGAGNLEYWSWDFGDPTSGINNTSSLPNPTHLFSNPGTFTVTLLVTNFNNCTDTIQKQVVVYPHPPVDFIYTTACLNELVYFDPDTTVTEVGAIATWHWNFGDGQTANGPNVAHQYSSTGDFTVTLTVTDTSGCQNVVQDTIEIHPLPVAHFDAGLSNCAGASVTFTNQSSSSNGFIVRWEYDFGDGNSATVNWPDNPTITHVYSTANTYNVILTITASDSCTDQEAQLITIQPNPLANFSVDVACSGTPVQFTDISQLNGAGSIQQWQWNFGDPGSGISNNSSQPSPTHVFTTSGTFIVELIVTTGNGCTDTVSKTITVNPLPAVNFTTTNNCENNVVLFNPDLTVMSPGAINSWLWNFGDSQTSPIQNATHTYTTSGPYLVTLTITDTSGCINSFQKTVNITPEPTANFSASAPACKDSEVTFTNLSGTIEGYIVKCEWDFNDGNTQTVTTLAAVSHIFASYGTFNVSLTVTTNDSCTNTIIIPVTVSPNPLANFTHLTSCVNAAVVFDDISQPGSGNLAVWSWNFGDPPSGTNNVSSQEDPSHTYNSAGTYQVTLVVTNTGGCMDTIVKPVVVQPLPVADFSISPGCVDDSTQFISSTFINSNAVQSILWEFGDSFTAADIEDPYHEYATSGTFQVTLTITDTAGCVNTKTKSVSIVPPPISFFQVSDQTCANNPIFFTNFSSTPGGTFTSYYYDFGDGSDTLINAPANGNVSHIYSVAGTFTVTLKVSTTLGCEAESQKTFTVSASPQALFDYDNTCVGTAVNFNDLSQVNSGTSIVGWLWNFGDPTSGTSNTSNLQNPLHVFNVAGTYTVLLQVENASGCPDTVSHQLTVQPKPPVDFTWLNTCLGTTTEFTTNTAVTNINAVSSFDWDFGDGSAHNTTQQDPQHAYASAGNYTAILTIVDTAGCENAVSHVITITPQPVALFSIESACLGASTYFTDESFTLNGEQITAWLWNFDDTGSGALNTSTLQNPAHIYNTLGVYDVSLIVTSASGCQDTITQTIQVFGNPTANFTFTAAPCDEGAVFFQDSSFSQQATIVAWTWEFEPNHFSNLQNPVYNFYATDSCYTVRLIATDVRGCVDTAFKEVCVPAAFKFTFNSSPTCHLDTTYFTPQLLAPSTDSLVFFNWNFGDPASGIYNNSTLKNPAHYYSTPGTYTVRLQATDINNCIDEVFIALVVLPLPVPSFTFTEGVCDSTIYFDEASTGSGSNINKWIWNFGDGNIDTISAPNPPDISHLYTNSGLYYVSLTIVNNNGCINTLIDSNVLVKPCMQAEFELIDTLVCQNNMLTFADSSYSGIPATEWFWDFGDGSDTTYFSPTNPINHVFSNSGNFAVKLRITSEIAGRKVSDSVQYQVVVIPTPLPDFSYEKLCYLQSTEFTNMTSGNGTQVEKYSWTFGEPTSSPNDTSSIRNPNHLYNSPGTYDVKLVAQNTIGCRDSIQKQLIVYGLPDANYDYTLSCAGDKTLFEDLSVLAVAPITTWEWTFSDNSGIVGRRDIQNPEFIFNTAGDYLVNLMVTDTNGCYDTINQTVKTWSIPTSVYTYTDNFNNVQGQLQFTNISIDGVKYYWTFGNGDDSYAENPVAFYQNDGTYEITLVTWNDKECSDTLTMEYKFMVKGLYIPNAFSPENPKKEVQQLKAIGINLKSYKLEVYDRWGNILWWTDKLDAEGRPTEGWDGRFNGVLMQEGVYVWKAYGIFLDGTIWEADNVGNNENLPQFKTGTATMLR